VSEVPPVHVLFWFDVEDYLTPESDDALLGLLDCFERQGVQGTWKVVAEKARVLEERGREDVIRALQRQDIGYHTDTHSQHPVLAEYLRSAGWEDGVEEIIRRERPGYEDTVRILGPSSTFGQAGGSWAPQIYPFMRDAGIPLFMDEASHIGLDGAPFWYCNVPHINRLETRVTRMDFEAGEEGLRQGIGRFDEIHRDVVDDGGGLISIYYHPCEFATLAFWDGVNFARGQQPPRPQWKPAPLRGAQQMAAGLELFDRYLGHVVAQPGVEVLTGRQLLNLLPDNAADRVFSIAELADMLTFSSGAIEHRFVDADTVLAPSEIFALVVEALLQIMLTITDEETENSADTALDLTQMRVVVGQDTPLGPVRRQATTLQPDAPLASDQLLEAAIDVDRYLQHHGRMPDAIWLGSEAIAPADFLITAADLLRKMAAAQRSRQVTLPSTIPLRTGHLDSERHVHDDVWNWVVFAKDFDAPGLIELARLQAWTLKPALLHYG
jgi:hypothetical protein